MSNLWLHGLQPTRLLCPWDSPGKNTGVGSISFSRGSSRPRDRTQVPHSGADALTSEPPGKQQLALSAQFSYGRKWRGTEKPLDESKSEVAQSCPTLCDPMDCSLPGFSVHGIFQARILEWVAISFSRRSSWPRDWTSVSCVLYIGRWILYQCAAVEATYQ